MYRQIDKAQKCGRQAGNRTQGEGEFRKGNVQNTGPYFETKKRRKSTSTSDLYV